MGGILSYLNDAVTAQVQSGSLTAVFFAFLLGVLVGFTPCVYPVLPVTVAFIGGISGGRRLRGLLYSAIYVLGMALVYTGVVLLFKKPLGALWGNGWALLVLANFFILLALWQLGVIRIPIPQFVKGGVRRYDALGALGVGAASGLVVGPCTIPGLAAILTLASSHQGQTGSLLFAGLVLFAYSLGLGSLVLLCGTFSGLLASLPKSGRWLNVVEKCFAVIMLLAAEMFLIMIGQSNFPNVAAVFAAGSVGAGLKCSYTSEIVNLDDKLLQSFVGKKGVVLVFFATWCPPCINEVPAIQEFTARYSNRAVQVLGAAVDQDAHTISAFRESQQINYRLVLDPDWRVANGEFGISGVPAIIGIDATGAVRYRSGQLPADMDAFVAQLETGAHSPGQDAGQQST